MIKMSYTVSQNATGDFDVVCSDEQRDYVEKKLKEMKIPKISEKPNFGSWDIYNSDGKSVLNLYFIKDRFCEWIIKGRINKTVSFEFPDEFKPFNNKKNVLLIHYTNTRHKKPEELMIITYYKNFIKFEVPDYYDSNHNSFYRYDEPIQDGSLGLNLKTVWDNKDLK